MKAREKTRRIHARILARTGVDLSLADVTTLRRAEMTLQRWYEMECGDWNGNVIERDETTGKPSMVHYGQTATRKWKIADRESGAIRRIKAVCSAVRLHYFIQSDPRGCALYVSKEPMTDSDYSGKGVAVCE